MKNEARGLRCGKPLLRLRYLLACTYNVMSLVAPSRVHVVVQQLAHMHVIGMQGTRFKYSPQRGACETHTCDRWRLLHWGYDCGRHTNRVAGLSIAINPVLQGATITQVYSPPSALQGRGGSVRLKMDGLDLLVVVIYVPPEQEGGTSEVVDAIVEWANGVLSRAPARCLPMLLCDANGKVGKTLMPDEHHDLLVGMHNKELDNGNGSRIRGLCGTHFVTLANTIFQGGPTFFGSSNRCSRIDYIAVPQTYA